MTATVHTGDARYLGVLARDGMRPQSPGRQAGAGARSPALLASAAILSASASVALRAHPASDVMQVIASHFTFWATIRRLLGDH